MHVVRSLHVKRIAIHECSTLAPVSRHAMPGLVAVHVLCELWWVHCRVKSAGGIGGVARVAAPRDARVDYAYSAAGVLGPTPVAKP